jgi:hypothetical protein
MSGDVVFLNVSGTLPITSTVQPYADRLELRFGRAYPVTLTIDRDALDRIAELIEAGRRELDAAKRPESTVEGVGDGHSG